jgi:Cu+-exporting ATPase
LRQLVELLADIGYEPDLSLERAEKKQNSNEQQRLIKQIALAGFCFGNIMMFSFPEYFGFGNTTEDARFSALFKGLNMLLAVPALIYSGRDYLISAWKAVKKGVVHINIPLALGMLALFGRSSYEIMSGVGAGYMDSLTGLIFFLLVGKWFQEYTYGHIRFERDYKSYFPLMFILSLGRAWKGLQQRLAMRKLIPWMAAEIGILFIVRGMNLGIPYLSPKMTQNKHQTEVECCHPVDNH